MPETLLQKRVAAANAVLAAGGALRNPRTSPFNTLALTCLQCGSVVSTPLSNIRKSSRASTSKCPCYSRRSADGQWRRAVEDEEYRADRNRKMSRATKRRNDALRSQATNHGKEWTGPELEILSRADLTASQAAKLLGRSLHAVRTAQHEVQKDPRKFKLAGIEYRPRRPGRRKSS